MRLRRLAGLIHVAKGTVALIAVAVTLLLSASAQAATVSQKIYKIFTTEYKAQLAYSAAQLQANITADQTKLAPTASSIDALSSSNSTAATALIDELENQYDADGAIGVIKPALTAFTALSKLPLTAAQHKETVADKADIKRILAIKTSRDLTDWQAASFAPASEPADTSSFGGILGISPPSIDLPVTGSTTSIKAFEKLDTKASDKTSAVFNTLSSDWATWVAGFGIESG